MFKRGLLKSQKIARGISARVRDIRSPEVRAAEDVRYHIGSASGKTVLFIAKQYEYGDPARGLSYEHLQFYHTLLRSGHSIAYFPIDAIRLASSKQNLSRIVREAVYYYQPDILLYYHTFDWISHDVWQEISREFPTKTIMIAGDDFVRFEETRPVWSLFNGVVTMDPRTYERRKEEGFSSVFLSQWGANHFLYRDFGLPRIHGAVFIGQCYGGRPEVIRELKNREVAIETFGRGWPGSKRLSYADVLKLYNQSNIIFNMHTTAQGTFAINARDFETAACGALILTQASKEAEQYFTPGTESVAYENLNDAADKIKYYLSHPEERDGIAAAGHERFLREHTYEKRFQDIFAFIDTVKK